jgi:hypothetical protein
VSNILIIPLFICLSEQDQAPFNTFNLLFPLIVVDPWGSIGMATMLVGVAM